MRIIYKAGFAAALATMSTFSLCAETKPETQLISSLSGTWKEDQTKRKLGSTPGLRFRTNAEGGLEELRGPEARPMVQPVKLDGKSYAMEGGNTMIWKQVDANAFERRTALNGKPMSVRYLRISGDGKILTEESERFSHDGKSMKQTAQFRKESADGKGLLGTWRLLKVQDSEPAEVRYAPDGPGALRVTGRMGSTHTLFFDGKTSPIEGANVIPGMKISVKAIDGNTMETTTTREGVRANNAHIVLSEGGKVMTVTTTGAGAESSREPSVVVFNKQ